MQEPEWNEEDSDVADDEDLLHLDRIDGEGGDETEGREESSTSWAGALLQTRWGSFLHGLTGTKVQCTAYGTYSEEQCPYKTRSPCFRSLSYFFVPSLSLSYAAITIL